ncbi:helix-turn-helix DNA-binding protein [Mycobacterium phage Anthony]|uniref:Helix-turn-helix DNA-binding protein n=1 Tax=Mycobacterium phage Anthony TaxID=2599857 RepID=A0A5J6THH0_9CAUD|nr:helix-turn-helix DNA-binding protein [Mycobacterium phage Anthony]QFG10433.1 helix-turn-helix DNA-binding protein [Mycobacterium phage Anthony]
MSDINEGTPEHPRNWTTAHPSLRSKAPHEPAAVLRRQAEGVRGTALMKEMSMRGTQLIESLNDALEKQMRAASLGQPLHYATVPKGTV